MNELLMTRDQCQRSHSVSQMRIQNSNRKEAQMITDSRISIHRDFHNATDLSIKNIAQKDFTSQRYYIILSIRHYPTFCR